MSPREVVAGLDMSAHGMEFDVGKVQAIVRGNVHELAVYFIYFLMSARHSLWLPGRIGLLNYFCDQISNPVLFRSVSVNPAVGRIVQGRFMQNGEGSIVTVGVDMLECLSDV
jgi:hypothetical protein